MDSADPAAVADGLRAVLAAIDHGDVEASDVERAHLSGSLAAFDSLATPPAVHDTDV